MTIEIDATYEDGVLKLDQPLPMPQKQRLRIKIELPATRAGQSAGLVRWTGTVEDLEYLAESAENGLWDFT